MTADGCVIWGKGPDEPECQGTGTVRAPVPSRPPRRWRAAGAALWAILAAGAPALLADGSNPVRDGVPPPAGAPDVDPALGIASADLPIEVPPGRHGMQPALALRYGGASGPGNAGFGFNFDVGAIERSTRFGPPRFDDSDLFVLSLGGVTYDLAPIDAAGARFRTNVDTGFAIRRVVAGGFTFWTARGRDGRAYRFGYTGGGVSPGPGSQVANFKWGLDRVEDALGNVMTIDYQPAGARLYVTRIDYAAHPATGLAASNTVGVCWQARGDSKMTPSGETFAHRLASITTLAGGAVARAWRLAYDTPGADPVLGFCPVPTLPLPPPPESGDPPDPTLPGPKEPGGRRQLTQSGSSSFSMLAAPSPVSTTTSTTTASTTTVTTPLPPDDSLLTTIARSDGSGAALPPITYRFTFDTGGSWGAASSGTIPLPFVLPSDVDQDSGVRIEDLNRDGLADLVQFSGSLQSTLQIKNSVYLNRGGTFVLDPAWSASLLNLLNPADSSRNAFFTYKRGSRDWVEMGVRFMDVNDDGYPDLVRHARYYGLVRKGVYLNTGSGFTSDQSASYPLPDEPFVSIDDNPSTDVSHDLGVRLADVNGDGRADILVARGEWGGSVLRRVYLQDRGAYRLDSRYVLPNEAFVRHVPHGNSLDMGVRLMDLNGDGLIDIFVAANVNGTLRNVAYLHGGRPDGTPTWRIPETDWWLGEFGERFVDVSSAGDGGSLDRGLRVTSLGRSGYATLIAARSWNGTVEKRRFSARPGGGWSTSSFDSSFPGLFVTKASGGVPHDTGARLVDLDGDGSLDFAVSLPSQPSELRLNGGYQTRPMLRVYSNGIGGTTAFEYAPAPHGGGVDGGGPAALPFPLVVVARRVVADGRGHTYATRYHYDGPFYHHAGREFRGFRMVEVTDEGAGRVLTTWYHQQPGLRSAPLRGAAVRAVDRRLADGAVFTRTDWTHDISDALVPLAHPLLRQETTLYDWTTDDPDSPAFIRRTATAWSYTFDESANPPDRLMRRRVERREGDTTDPGDDRILVEDFAAALDGEDDSWSPRGRRLLDVPIHQALSSASGAVVEESWVSYDGQAYGELGAAGLATREERRGGPPGPAGVRGQAGNPAVARAYDAYGNLATETDPRGGVRSIGRGTSDPTFTFPDHETNALGHRTAWTFDSRDGQVRRVTDPNGRVTSIETDGFGRRTSEYGPDDSPERPTVAYLHDYDAMPARVFRYARETSGAGERAGTSGCLESIAFFDGLGRLLETKTETDGGLMVVSGAITFDAAGRVATIAEPFLSSTGPEYVDPALAEHAGRREYDDAGRIRAAINAAGEVRREEISGWTTTLVDPLGHRRDVHRNAFGDVVRVDEHEGRSAADWRPASTATYAYDAAGRMTRATGPSGATTTMAYDALGRRTALDDPHAGSWRYAYDLAGNLVEETDPLGRVTRMTFDALQRMTAKELPDGAAAAWGFDEGGAAAGALGRLTSIADGSGSQRFRHDPYGRVVEATRVLDGVPWTVATTYDAMARVTSVGVAGRPGVTYAYDTAGHLAAATPFAPRIVHDMRGLVTRIDLANGASIQRDYDAATGRPTRLRVEGRDGVRLLDDRYAYHLDGLIAAIEDGAGTPRTASYEYDGRHRLVRAVDPARDLRYAYDDSGDLVSKEGVAFTYGVPARPQWLSRTAAGVSYAYDPLGQVTSIRGATVDRRLEYDVAGRLVRWQDLLAGRTVSETWDASGHRVREIVEAPGTRSVLLTPMPQIEVRDGAVTLRHFAGTLRLATVGDDRTLYPIVDHLGSTRLVLDQGGSVVSRYTYRPYGEELEHQGEAASQTFATAWRVPETGLLLVGSRFYDPAIGRFLQPDALVAEPLDPHALNRYAYARGNPVNLVDPQGRNPIPALLVMGAVALLDRQTRGDVATSVALTAASIFLTGALGPGFGAGWTALKASEAALYASALTPVLLRSALGQGFVSGTAAVLQELGASPRAAAVAGSVLPTFLFNSSFQRGFARQLAARGEAMPGADIGDHLAFSDYVAGAGGDVSVFGSPTGDSYGTPLSGRIKGSEYVVLESFGKVVNGDGCFLGVYGTRDLLLGFDHGAIGFLGHDAARSSRHFAYLAGGISTQQFAREIYAAGYSGSLFTFTGRASDFLIEFVYGPYGGGLATGIDAGRHAGTGPPTDRSP